MRRIWSVAAAALVALTTVGVLAVPETATADVDPKIPADARLKPGETFTKVVTDLSVGSNDLIEQPAACRTHVAFSKTCDAFRIEFDRDLSPAALNTAYFTLEFDQIQGPTITHPAGGLNPPPVNDLNLYVWDEPGHYLGSDSDTNPEDQSPNGNTFSAPERGGFAVKKKAYDITVQNLNGINSAYTLRVTFSNERFSSPFEALDQFFGPTGQPPAAAPAFNGDDYSASDGGGLAEGFARLGSSLPDLAPTLAQADGDIARIGFGIDSNFNPRAIDLRGSRARPLSAVGRAPSGLTLALALVVLPVALAAAAGWWLRRRRALLIA